MWPIPFPPHVTDFSRWCPTTCQLDTTDAVNSRAKNTDPHTASQFRGLQNPATGAHPGASSASRADVRLVGPLSRFGLVCAFEYRKPLFCILKVQFSWFSHTNTLRSNKACRTSCKIVTMSALKHQQLSPHGKCHRPVVLEIRHPLALRRPWPAQKSVGVTDDRLTAPVSRRISLRRHPVETQALSK